MNEATELYSASAENLTLRTISIYKAEGKMHEYYEQVGNITDNLKDSYRTEVRNKIGSR